MPTTLAKGVAVTIHPSMIPSSTPYVPSWRCSMAAAPSSVALEWIEHAG